MNRYFTLFFSLIIVQLVFVSQNVVGFDPVNEIKEKIYASTDRNLYLTGEKVYCNILLFDEQAHAISEISKIAYVELANKKYGAVVQETFALENGKGFGIFSIPDDIRSGVYTLRAYTNWMKNSGLPTVFEKSITIVNPFNPVSFVTETENLYVTFYPRGGKLLENCKTRVAFRFFGLQAGQENVRAELVDENENLVASFNPGKNGLGSFDVLCEKTMTYSTLIYVGDSLWERQGFVPVLEAGVKINDAVPGEVEICSSFPHQINGGKLIYIRGSDIVKKDNLAIQPGINKVALGPYRKTPGVHYFLLYDDKDSLVSHIAQYHKAESDVDLTVQTNKNLYHTREKVTVEFMLPENVGPASPDLWVSVSYNNPNNAWKIDNISSHVVFNNSLLINPDYGLVSEIMNNEELCNAYLQTLGVKPYKKPVSEKDMYVPEVKGNIISGNVFNRKNDKPVPGERVILSVVGKKANIQSSVTNNNGEYFFYLPQLVKADEIVLALARQNEDYYILPGYKFMGNYPTPEKPFLVDIDQKPFIEGMMVNMQVNKNYNQVIDSGLTHGHQLNRFYDNPDEVIELSEYIELPNMQEILFELAKKVVLGNEKGQKTILIADNTNNKPIGKNPLYLIDGIRVMDAREIFNLIPIDIEKINVVAAKYFYGDQIFDGILDVITKTGKYPAYNVSVTSLRQKYDQPLLPFVPAWPTYENITNSRIPDYRNTLYFSPGIAINQDGLAKIEFYTADNSGDYRIVVHGTDNAGKKYSGTGVFRVQ